MPLTLQEIRSRATTFAKEWSGVSKERAEAQTFWNEFFGIFGVSRRRLASYDEPAKRLSGGSGFIDLFWPGTLLVEHKSAAQNLDSAYAQGLDYFGGLKDEELPHYIIVSDFAHFRLYDLDVNEVHTFPLAELSTKIHLFSFISGYKKRLYRDEDPVNIEAAEKIGKLHDALFASGYRGHDLEV